MTFRSWPDVPAGVPVHHHCVVSIESSADPARWTDATSVTPALVAWQYPDALEWVRDQLIRHRDEAERDRAKIDKHLDLYAPVDLQAGDHYPTREGNYLPTTWERLANTLQMGRWVIEPYQIAVGRKLVIQMIGYADSAGRGGQSCSQHRRPDDKPYLGLTKWQEAHAAKYAHA